ncbi:MAG: hypothetical protein WKH97_08245 [Casimicrobiaceae bacterium]
MNLWRKGNGETAETLNETMNVYLMRASFSKGARQSVESLGLTHCAAYKTLNYRPAQSFVQ